jgi:YD repeat-containing protein
MSDTAVIDGRADEVGDAARGRRRVGYAPDGTPAWIERADGTRLDIERDDRRGMLRVLDFDGPLLSLRRRGDRVVADDREGTTTAWRTERSSRIERDASGEQEAMVLRVDRDPKGRPRRVRLPGSSRDLHYRRREPGRWLVTAADGAALLVVEEERATTRITMPGGHGFEERRRRGMVSLASVGCGRPIARTDLDASGRIVGRRDARGREHRYERDGRQRLVRWLVRDSDSAGREHSVEWHFDGENVAGTTRDGRRRRYRLDDAGRPTALLGDGPTVRYAYDRNGARVGRSEGEGTTRYGYDALGQLVDVTHPDETRTSVGWDGLGRRVWIEHEGRRLHEHRDVDGRLWSVTDEHGQAVHTFVWWRDRVIARLDGPVGDPVAELYLTDPLGTLVAVMDPDGAVESVLDDPRGSVSGEYRPTLFGHIADGLTGLVPFGARDYDPESGIFLSPDPWHLGLDDPRVLSGARPDRLAIGQESPREGIHPYALGQFDPVSRPDLDGHVAWGNIFLSLILAPTWGFPLTSLSLFFFLPVNIYFELIGLVVFIFTDHPWPQHSIVNAKFLAASSQIGTLGFALNGFLPRVISGGGVDADRAVTIGHVAWENRRYFELLDRPRVLTVQDLAGPPDANGRPSGGLTAFSRAAQGSIVVVEGTDDDGRVWLHGSWWTRGGASHVGVRGVTDLAFEDRVPPGTAHSTGTILLAQPLPESMTTPEEADDDGVLGVTEYAPTHRSTGEILTDQWFAISVDDDAGFAVGDAVRIQADDDGVAPVYAAVHQILDAEEPILILDHELPARFQLPDLKEDLELTKLDVATGSGSGNSAGWQRTNPARRGIRHPAPAHSLLVGGVLRIEPTPTTPAPERPLVYGEIETVRLTLEFDVPLPAGQVGATIATMVLDGEVARGTVPDPAGAPAEVAIAGDHDFEVGEVLAIYASGTDPHHVRIAAISAATPPVLTVDPPIPNTVVSVAGTAVNLARLEGSDEERDTATVNAETAGTSVTVDARSNEVFAAGTAVRIDQGGSIEVRTVTGVTNTTVVLTEEMAPMVLGPDFEVTVMSLADDTESGDIAASRFIRRTAGDLPSVYGTWPAEIMGVVPNNYWPESQPFGWRFFVRPTGPIAGLHPDFRDSWEPLTLAGDEYWLLASPLKIVHDDGNDYWEPDPDDTFPRRHRLQLPAVWEVTVRAFERAATPVVRPLAGGAPVLCRPAETQVPDDPRVRWSLADALDEHELAHTMQNSYWGPLLGALPLQGLFRTVPETFAATGRERPDWMLWNPFDEAGEGVGFDDTNVFELLSMAGLMQLVWTFVILGPALANDNARRFLLGLSFKDWGQVFNPVNQQIINAVPEIDPNADAGDRWGLWAAHLATTAIDMRRWTPLVGLVPLLLPDAATNFVEQQASRWTGDLYSTILTVDDVSNRTLRLRPGAALLSENRDADVTIALGRASRIMVYHSTALGRFLELDRCDAPTRVVHLESFRLRQMVEVRLDSVPGGADALLPAGHFGVTTGAASTIDIDGPELPDPSNPGTKVRGRFTFMELATGDIVRPTPRSLVPVAPAVVRAFGFYLLAASEGTYTIEAYDSDEGTGDGDPHTYHATVTIAGQVALDGVPVAWAKPLATGSAGPPPAPATDDVSRFETESVPLTVDGQDTTAWIAEGEGGLTVTPAAAGNGWSVRFADPATGLPARGRLRIWRPVRGDDAELFDFQHEDEPTRVGIRSYIDEETWIPIRDFSVEIASLPALNAAPFEAAAERELAVPVVLAGAGSIRVTPTGGRTLAVERVGEDPPRGERWSFELSGRKAVEAPITFPVVVSFGRAPDAVERPFDLTVNPNFTIDTNPAGGPYVVSEAGGPLVLQIASGTAPFEVESDLPDGVTAQVSGRTVTITADGTATAGRHVLVLEDDDDRLGIREVRIEL